MNSEKSKETRVLVLALCLAFAVIAFSGAWRWRAQQAEWERQGQMVRQEESRLAAKRAANNRRWAQKKLEQQKAAKELAERRRRNALIEAAEYGKVNSVRWLLQQGYDPNYKTDYGWSPLYAVIERAYLTLPRFYDDQENKALYKQRWNRAVNDRAEIVRLLVRYGAKINVKFSGYGSLVSPLQIALNGGYEGPALRPVVLELLKAGADPNEKFGKKDDPDSGVGTPLGSVSQDWEKRNEPSPIIGDLLRFGARREGRDWWGRTPLLQLMDQSARFSQHNNKQALYLLQRGAKVNGRDRDKRTPLHAAFGATATEESNNDKSLDADLIRALLKRGANPHARDKKGRTPLHVGIENLGNTYSNPKIVAGKLSLLKLLIRYGANPHARDNQNQTPLFYAVSGYYSEQNDSHHSARISAARLLLQHGVNVNARNKKGETPLLAALQSAGPDWADLNEQEMYKMVTLLLQAGAKANARTEDGTSALKIVQKKYAKVRALLKRWGAKP